MTHLIPRSTAALCLVALFISPGAADASSSLPGYAVTCLEKSGKVTPPKIVNESEIRFAIEAASTWFADHHLSGGTATVEVLVGADGQVKLTRICKSSNKAYVDEMGQTIASMMKFQPARKSNKPVEAWITIPVEIAPGHRDPSDTLSFQLPLPRL